MWSKKFQADSIGNNTRNVEFDSVENVKDPSSARIKKEATTLPLTSLCWEGA